MTTGNFCYTTPKQLQDYLTCPLMFNFKHILKIPEPLTGEGWLGMKIHETLHNYQQFRKEHPKEKSSIDLDTQFCLVNLSRCFNNFKKIDSNKLPINWKKETPESTLQLGEELLTVIIRYHDFRKVLFHDTEKSFLFHLMPDHNNGTFIPWEVATDMTLSIDCCFDAISADQTILEYHTCRNTCSQRETETKIKYDLLGLALHLKNSHPTQQSIYFKCFNIVKKNKNHFIQRIAFEKNNDDRLNFLVYLYEINCLIATKKFPPIFNNLCLNHCSYNNRCWLLKKKERN
jgi:hypothetical protein